MSVDILGTSWDQCRSMVQYSFTSTETIRLVRTDSPVPRLSPSSWTMSVLCVCTVIYVPASLQNLPRAQDLCESRGGHPGLSVLTSLMVFMDVKEYWTMLTHWSQLIPNNVYVNRHPRTLSNTAVKFPLIYLNSYPSSSLSCLDRPFHKPRQTIPVSIECVYVYVSLCAWMVCGTLAHWAFVLQKDMRWIRAIISSYYI